MDALERMPSFLGLPILERSASLFFPRSSLSFFLYIFQLLTKESIRWETADKCHICMFKVTWAEPCFEKFPPPFKKLCWCNNIKACNWYYAKHWNGMFCQKKRVKQWGDNSTLVTTFVICESCSKIDNGQRWLNKKARLCACATHNKVIHKRKRWLISIVWSGNQDLVAAKPNRTL